MLTCMQLEFREKALQCTHTEVNVVVVRRSRWPKVRPCTANIAAREVPCLSKARVSRTMYNYEESLFVQ